MNYQIVKKISYIFITVCIAMICFICVCIGYKIGKKQTGRYYVEICTAQNTEKLKTPEGNYYQADLELLPGKKYYVVFENRSDNKQENIIELYDMID